MQTETPPDWGGSETDENQPEPHHNHESSDDGGAKPGLQPMAVLTGGKTLGLWNKQRNTRTQTRGANGGATPPPSTTRSTNRAPFRTGGRLDYETKGTRRPSTQ